MNLSDISSDRTLLGEEAHFVGRAWVRRKVTYVTSLDSLHGQMIKSLSCFSCSERNSSRDWMPGGFGLEGLVKSLLIPLFVADRGLVKYGCLYWGFLHCCWQMARPWLDVLGDLHCYIFLCPSDILMIFCKVLQGIEFGRVAHMCKQVFTKGDQKINNYLWENSAPHSLALLLPR